MYETPRSCDIGIVSIIHSKSYTKWSYTSVYPMEDAHVLIKLNITARPGPDILILILIFLCYVYRWIHPIYRRSMVATVR